MTGRSTNFGFIIPTPEEDAQIQAGIAADPDAFEVPSEQFKAMVPFARRGRPPLPEKRPTLNMRIDSDVLAALKSSGAGWQTRLNALLREAMEQGRLR